MLNTRNQLKNYRNALKDIEWFYNKGMLNSKERYYFISLMSGVLVTKQFERIVQKYFEEMLESAINSKHDKWQGLMHSSLSKAYSGKHEPTSSR